MITKIQKLFLIALALFCLQKAHGSDHNNRPAWVGMGSKHDGTPLYFAWADGDHVYTKSDQIILLEEKLRLGDRPPDWWKPTEGSSVMKLISRRREQ